MADGILDRDYSFINAMTIKIEMDLFQAYSINVSGFYLLVIFILCATSLNSVYSSLIANSNTACISYSIILIAYNSLVLV